MVRKLGLRIPATVTVHLDDAVGQLSELKELLSLLGHTYEVEVEVERHRIEEEDRRLFGIARIVDPKP